MTEPKCIIDVGACVGLFVDDCLARYEVDKLYAFEPLKANYDYLVKKYRKESRVTVLHQAVSNFNGRAALHKKGHLKKVWRIPFGIRYDFPGNEGSSLKQKSNVSLKHNEDVSVIKLSDFILERGLNRISILKIDSEGSEYDILHDLLDESIDERIDTFYFEDHTRKVPGLAGTRLRFEKRISDKNIRHKFYLQDVAAGDSLAYVPLVEAENW